MGTDKLNQTIANEPPSLLRFIAVNLKELGFEKTANSADGLSWDFAATTTRPGFKVEWDGDNNYLILWAETPQPTPAWVYELVAAWRAVTRQFPRPQGEPSFRLVWRYGVTKYAEPARSPEEPNLKPDTVGFDPPSMVQFLRMHLGDYGLILDEKDENKGYHMVVAADGERNRFALSVKSWQIDVTIWTTQPQSGVPDWLDALRKAYESELERWHGEPKPIKLAVTWQFRLPSVPAPKMTAAQ